MILECSEKRAADILRIQKQMRVNDWQIQENANTGTDTVTDNTATTQKRTRQRHSSSK
jgi:hypothetical protein